MKKVEKKSNLVTYGLCSILGAGMICALVLSGNHTVSADEHQIAAITLASINSSAKEAMKSVEEVSTKKSAKKDTDKAENKEKEEMVENQEAQSEPQLEEAVQSEPEQPQQPQPELQPEPEPEPQQQESAPVVQQEEAPQPVQQIVTSPIAQTALNLVGSSMYCEELAEASINAVGRSAWITKTYMDGDVEVIEDTMGPDNFLQIASQVSLSNLQPGDLLWYANNGSGGSHIAVYVGNNQAVHGGYNGRNVELAGVYLPGASTPIGLRL